MERDASASVGRLAESDSRRTGWSRATPAIVLIAAIASVGVGVLIAGLWLGVMALVFRGADEVDGAGVAAVLVLGLGITLVLMLSVHLGVGVRLIRRGPLDRGRTAPTVALLAVPVLVLIVVPLLDG